MYKITGNYSVHRLPLLIALKKPTLERFPYIVSHDEQYMEIVRFTSFDQLPFFHQINFPRTTKMFRFSYRQQLPGESPDLFFCATESIARGNVSGVTDHLRFYIDMLRLMERISYIHRTRHARAPDNHAILIGHSYKSYSSVLESKQQKSIKIKCDCQNSIILS